MRLPSASACSTAVGLAVGALAPLSSAQRLSPTLERPERDETRRELLEQFSAALQEDGESEEGEADDLVEDLPGLDPTTKVTQHAGRISLDDDGKNNLFYWHFPAASNPDKAPLVIWLNGGPGCSSMQGLFLGISPFKLMDGTTIGSNEFSWHHTANLLFVDQPVGTGMSYTRGNDYRTDETAIAADFYQFMVKFVERHTEYLTSSSGVKRTRPLFIFGESHAGRYIPNFSKYIQEQNSKTDIDIELQLEGVAIGNGWVHPRIQYDYSDYAHGLGLLTFGQVRSLKTAFADCTKELDAGTYFSSACLGNMDDILGSIKTGKGGKSLNYYDVRDYVKSVSSYPDGQRDIVSYLNQKDVRQALHANTKSDFHFDVCSNDVYRGLSQFDGVSTLETVQSLLQNGLRMMFYNGQWDMMCNHYNTEKLLLNLDWNGSAEYQDAEKYTWTVEGMQEPAGFSQQGGNLTYLVVTGAGHMVPMDVPEAAADLARRFVQNLPFEDKAQTVGNTKMNATDLEVTSCFLPDNSAAVSSTLSTTASSSTVSLGAAWLWIALVVAAVSSVLAIAVTIMCMRGKQSGRTEHKMVTQESDEEVDLQLASPLGELDSFTVTKQSEVNVEEEDDADEDGDGTTAVDEHTPVNAGTEIDL